MSGFSADWLALREKADIAARSEQVLREAAAYFSNFNSRPGAAGKPFRVCDLGSGTGASVAAFSELFPKPLRWCLVDYDADNLALASARYAGDGAIDDVSVETSVHDLSATPAPWNPGTDLVTATALFDLTSGDWISGFLDRLCGDEIPLLTTITYDGRHMLAPSLPLDEEMASAFNTHQRGDKGFGPAAGPDAATHMISQLKTCGYEVVSGDSDWHLRAGRDDAMIKALLDGWADAVIEADLVPESKVRDWQRLRHTATDSLIVGHLDLFAAPGG